MSIVVERGNSNTTGTTTATAASTAAAANHINGNSYGLDHHLIGRSGLGGQRVTCFSMYANGNKPPAPELGAAGAGVGAGRKEVEEEDEGRSGESSSSTSSIGRNSDEESSAGRSSEAGDGEEVQSEYKGGALDSLEALEEVLPIKRSISQFYCGKSKSFTSLSDAANCSSMKDIVKPENSYTRKRKNLLACNNFWDKNRNGIRRNNSGGISKRAAGSRSSLALAASMGCTESSNNSDSSNSNSPSRGICLPPLPPQARRSLYNDSLSPPGQKFSPWRSFSLSDLQGATATPSISGIMVNNRHV
ncbi:suppressor protein SRP40-like isoform X1 [Coffea eugenioides]|uniref:suppressor protein SRP40-like isoform X1 n=1 Tax=Coffea eugenioides TaxID=49369 RepID=UPI000F604896|nr:suppressor protein SRP40-like isoform X1 [Coffea eugenioides]